MEIETIRHSLAHILADAVQDLWPGTKFGIGPAIENGFYYDFEFLSPISENDLPKIEKRMKELIKQNLEFKIKSLSQKEAEKLFADQAYKLELIKDMKDEKITIYESGEFTDLCAGPHVQSTKEIPIDGFKLAKTAGAYWRGSEKNPMLTRIYGLAFATKKELENYLSLLEEAEKRDHRILGEKLGLFMFDEKIGKGLPLWLPKGHFIRHLLEDYMYDLEEKEGYSHVLTPILAKEELYKTSGHLAHYKDDMYSPIEIEGEKYYLKPMNCPHHHSIYSHEQRSYRDLPLRIAEFGNVYRFERSGVLTGLIRTRGFTQNDAHIYATPETLEQEILNVLELFKKIYADFKIEDYWFRLSLPDFKNKEKYGDIENKEMWDKGAEVIKSVLQKLKLKFVEAVGEATFYGPKIDIQIKNVYGKEDSIATVQIDYYSSLKFNLSYIDKDGQKKLPVIIHRAFMGSFERFFAFLLEKTAGNLPLWLSPVQVEIINIGESHSEYAKDIIRQLKEAGIRTELGREDMTLGKKIRDGEMQKIPYLLIVGDKEMETKSVSVRQRGKGDLGQIELEKLIEQVKIEIESKK
ncbi:MAG: threonine--tRNA ligase [bacterium]|nr:threonine--tRNA ligase [bacterium]